MKIGEKKCIKCNTIGITIKDMCIYHYKRKNYERYKDRSKNTKMDR